jgi:hypothetical protein
MAVGMGGFLGEAAVAASFGGMSNIKSVAGYFIDVYVNVNARERAP